MEAIKFDFVSRKSYKNRVNSHRGVKTKGTCYLFFNENGLIIHEIVQIKESEYRRTDKDMIKTNYWKKENDRLGYFVQDFRKKFLPEIDNSKQTKKTEREKIPNEKIDAINKYFIESKLTPLTCLSLIAGCNTTGSQTNKNGLPFLYSGPNEDYYSNYNFFNFYKKLRKTNKNYGNDIFEEKISFINIQDYFERFKVVQKGKEQLIPIHLFNETKINK